MISRFLQATKVGVQYWKLLTTWVIFIAENCLAVAYVNLTHRGKIIKIQQNRTLLMLKEHKNTWIEE